MNDKKAKSMVETKPQKLTKDRTKEICIGM